MLDDYLQKIIKLSVIKGVSVEEILIELINYLVSGVDRSRIESVEQNLNGDFSHDIKVLIDALPNPNQMLDTFVKGGLT